MCGFIGIIGNGDVAEELYTGMLILQHRGQNGAGILTFDGNRFHIKKGGGLVSEVFNKDKISELKGNIGMGHVRYPTIGSSPERDAQPFQTSYPYGIGMAHNGNLVNYTELAEELTTKGRRQIRSKCDVEVIMKVFADELSKVEEENLDKKTSITALKSTMNRLNGSYSVVSIIARKGMLAFRDPHGIRPLVFGKKETKDGISYAFASESVALDVLGYKVIKDVEPGEAIFIDNDRKVTSEIIAKGKRAHCMFEWVYFARPDSVIENKGVYETRLNLGRELAKLWNSSGREADAVVPVPDSSRTAATTFANDTEVKYREGLIKNRYVGRTFIMPNNKERKSAIKLKLSPIILELRNKKLAVVDDSIVRGNTTKEITEILRKAGAEEVHIMVSCPPIKNPCYYGVDFPTRDELIASDRAVEGVNKKICADSLMYQTIDGLKRAIGLGDNICTACLTGEYPTDVSNYEKVLEETRKDEREEEE